jgi:hypothetical protein
VACATERRPPAQHHEPCGRSPLASKRSRRVRDGGRRPLATWPATDPSRRQRWQEASDTELHIDAAAVARDRGGLGKAFPGRWDRNCYGPGLGRRRRRHRQWRSSRSRRRRAPIRAHSPTGPHAVEVGGIWTVA